MAGTVFHPQIQNNMLQLLTDCSAYPENLVDAQEFQHELRACRDALDGATSLFHGKKRDFRILDLVDKNRSFSPLSGNLQTEHEIQQFMSCTTPDPLARYIFIQSSNSRGSLACEKTQLLLALSYHQVMPSFVNLVLEFKRREEPHTRTSFYSEVCLSRNRSRQPLPSLNRSGFRVQHCFNLIGVEKDAASLWRVRQTAAYHSFDVVERRSIWVFLKGNDLIRERVVMETERHRRARPDYPDSVQGCFLANLRSHMLVFQWSLENWPHYIDHLERALARFTAVANYTNVTKATEDGRIKQGLVKSGTFNSIVSRQRTGTWSSSSPTLPASPFSEKLSGFFKTRSDSHMATAKAGAPAVNSDSKSVDEPPAGDINLDAEFSFDKLQSLHRQGSEIQKSINIMAQNRRVLGEISGHFHKLLGSANFTTSIDLGAYDEEISDFFGRVEALQQSFAGYEARLRLLHQEVDKNAILFEGAIQYRNMRMGEFLAKQGLVSALQAEEMAIKSRREAASMHAITIWTLIFLPGTFVATFFSSGILDFSGKIKFGGWSTSWIGLQLFFAISLPIMILTLAGWGYFVYRAKKKEAFDEDDGAKGTMSDRALEEGRNLGITLPG